jgi:hypothetical protein
MLRRNYEPFFASMRGRRSRDDLVTDLSCGEITAELGRGAGTQVAIGEPAQERQ